MTTMRTGLKQLLALPRRVVSKSQEPRAKSQEHRALNMLGAVLAALAQLHLLADGPADLPTPKPKAASVSFADIGLVEFETPADPKLVIRYTLNGSAPKADSYAYCTPIRVASSLKLKAACFGADGKSGPAVEIACVRNSGLQKDSSGKLKGAINVDFSECPDLADWAKRAQKDAEEEYPAIAERLASEGFTPPRQAMLIFKKDTKVQIAATGGDKITFNRAWIDSHPKDTGTVIHELAHVIQAYKGRNPGWLVEGIADYIRWWIWEPPERRRLPNPARFKYTNSYQDTAAFLYWAEKQYDKDLVHKLNKHCRGNSYKDELFKEFTGKDLDTLSKEFAESLTKK